MNPKFSIITCTKDSEQYLEQNIKSVSEQTFNDFEHILVDGQSSDKTIEIICKYQNQFPDRVISIIRSPKGIADAMNEGIKRAKGEYIICLHSDDLFNDKNVLKDTAEFLKKHQPDWTYAKEMLIDSNGKEIKLFINMNLFRSGSERFFSKYLLKYFNFVRHQSVFIKKDVFNRFGPFDETFRIAMDYEYWLRIKNRTDWIFFDRIVDNFRKHDKGASSSPFTRTDSHLEEMQAGKMYMNWFEFYVLRFIFKILAKVADEAKEQIELYKAFRKAVIGRRQL